MAEFYRACAGRFVADEHFDESRFARAVHADQRHAVAALDGEARVGEYALDPVVLPQVLCRYNRAARGWRLGKFEMNDRLFLGNLNALDFFQFLDARLHLLGLGGLGPEPIDEGLKMLYALLLVAPCGLELLATFVFFLQVFRVIAVIDGEALVPDLHGAVDGDVEKIAVVRDENIAEWIALEIALEPVAGFEIEVVSGLVKQQQVGFGKQ